ncbi:energy transducer TonB [Stenotrophomonas tumulicola]|uniref:Energy transducer TonB n=1 Tax=Stenotrophomonas tumulicola TaxID=1685415 RepID=A0A7W3IGA1_9GAMM|nr:energy transducer TonB [Stenotrophomonas tumulicola]MBA8680705.1 energy transducer TonB [Stenotrophomonas tumulicola]
MNVTHASEVPASPEHQGDADLVQERRRPSPWLWVALIVAMFAAALMWLRMSNEEVAPAPIGERSLPATDTPVATTPATTPRTAPSATTTQKRTAPVVRNREARPLASNAKPDYPVSALRNGVQGSVVARLQVAPNGQVTEASIVSRSGQRDRDLDRAVLTTVRGWKFEPAMQNGRAVASVVNVPVDFQTTGR